VIDKMGHMRVVCKLTFLNFQYIASSQLYCTPESRDTSIIKYSLNPNKDQAAIEASTVYNMGIVML
jgi:hypothetical protein